MSTLKEIEQAMPAYLAHIVDKYRSGTWSYTPEQDRTPYVLKMIKEFEDTITYTVGKSYIKVVKGGVGASVHSFIVLEDGKKFKAGDILKPSSWNAPAKNFARGNVLNVDSYSTISWTGAY